MPINNYLSVWFFNIEANAVGPALVELRYVKLGADDADKNFICVETRWHKAKSYTMALVRTHTPHPESDCTHLDDNIGNIFFFRFAVSYTDVKPNGVMET